MDFKNSLFLTYLAVLLIFTAGCITYNRDSSYTMRFSVNETGEPLAGNVYNNGNLLGYTGNGSFNTNIEKLRPGLIALNGTYDNQPFEFYFEFPMEYLNYSGTNFSVSKNDIKKAIFDTSALDIPALEHAIFDLINEERRKAGIKALKWNDRIAQVAKNYSEVLSIEGFHHKDTEGKDVKDRLKENRIFYTIASENLFMMEGLNGSVNISETTVNGWMNSPAHRSPIMDRDDLFSDGAAGVYCEKKTCYAVMVFAGLELNKSMKLDPGYLSFFYLYDPAYPFDFDEPVSIDIDSTEYVNIFLVSGREQYDSFVQNRGYQSILESKQVKRFNTAVVASKGQGIIIQAAGDKSADINIHLRYS